MSEYRYGCPNCKSTDGFEQYDLVPGRAQIECFNDNAEPEWSGNTEMDWNDQYPDPKADFRYHCIACNKDFDKPVLVEVEDEDE